MRRFPLERARGDDPGGPGGYRLRTVWIGVRANAALIAVLAVLPFLPGGREYDRVPFLALTAVGGVALLLVAALPWQRVVAEGRELPILALWACADIVLVTTGMPFSGGGDSANFWLYALITVFFASVLPPRGQLALLLFTVGCYLAALGAMGWPARTDALLFRLSVLGAAAYLAGLLSRERDRETAEKEYLARHDPLTGLPNRTLFQERVASELAGAEGPLAVMLVDLDRFKEINDVLGHRHGDLLLAQVGPRLRRAVGDDAMVARLGGDEFAVLARVADATEASVIGALVGRSLEKPFEVDGAMLDVEASIGIALYPMHGLDAEALIQRADMAMYSAKDAHTGHELFSEAAAGSNPARLALLGEVRRALEEEELVLRFQPEVEVRTGRLVAAEALVRWQHPARGWLAPSEFVPLIEQTSLIRPLTTYVLERALRQVAAWEREGVAIRVAVNLSVRNLQDTTFPEAVAATLARVGLTPDRLDLEINERAVMANEQRALGVLDALAELGVGLALDDFGEGFTSLAHLKRLPLKRVKIDKSFVVGLDRADGDSIIVRSVVNIARNLGLEVIAEGVESQSVLRELRDLGCDCAQGYYLARPMPGEAFVAWNRGRRSTVPAPVPLSAAPTA